MGHDVKDIDPGFELGIYLDMPMQDYLKIKALSRSGIEDLHASPLTFWRRSPFNPHLEEQEEKESTTRGTAYHKRILEGREAFEAEYAVEAEMPDGALAGGEQLRNRCGELGLAKNGTLAEMAIRIRATETAREVELTPLAHFIEREHAQANQGKTFIPRALWEDVEIAAKAVESDEQLAALFEGGQSEVTLLWRDPIYGVPMKARCDRKTPKAWLDLKSFGNPNKKPLEQAIGTAMANYNYGLQAMVNLTGLEALGEPVDKAVFIFVENCRFPNVASRQFQRMSSDPFETSENIYWAKAVQDMNVGIYNFAINYARFGEGPWIEPAELQALEDFNYPRWFLGV